MSTSSVPTGGSVTSPAGEATRKAVFATTHWSVVLAAGRTDTPEAEASLEKLCQTYWRPLLRTEVSNRAHWMATRALGRIGDKTAVPDLIPLLYHNNNNVRWWAQISLVELTGQNFGPDWKACGDWWNSQHSQPPPDPQMARWWRGQAESAQLAASLAEGDRRFITSLKRGSPAGQPAAKAEEE